MKHYLRYYGVFTLIGLVFTAIASRYIATVLRFLLIVAMLFLLFIVRVQAQEKPKAPALPAKPTFEQSVKANDLIPYKLLGSFTTQQAQDYLFFESVGEAGLAHSKQISADDYTRTKDNHALVLDSLKAKLGHQVLLWWQDKQAKFTADTAAKYHPKNK